MSGRGETPSEEAEDTITAIAHGERVYNSKGQLLGRARGHEDGGFFVTTREGMEQLSIEHARSGHDFGEAHLMWRCMECGEMGRIDDGLPESCPNCGTETENIMWWTED